MIPHPIRATILFSVGREVRLAGRYCLRRPVILVLILYCGVLLTLKSNGYLNRACDVDPSHWAGRVGAMTGVVTQHPDPRLSGCVYIVETEAAEFFDEPRTQTVLNGRLLLHVLKSTEAVAAPGDRIRCFGRLQSPAPARVPGTFDYDAYLENQNIRSVIYTSSSSIRVLGASGQLSLTRAGWILKKRIVAVFQRYLSPEEATVLAGLSVGLRPRFFPEIKRIFTESGTMHLLVASGSNVAFVATLFFFFFRFVFRIPKNFSLVLLLAPIWLYVLLVGSDAPITRAGLMASIGIAGYLLMREDQTLNALCLAALAILIPSPKSLFDVGFQMSFVTVFGLIHFLSMGPEWLEEKAGWKTWTLRLALSTLTAQLWLIPITTNVFHQFYPVGLLANIVMLPLAAAGLPAALLVTLIPTVVHYYLSALIGVVTFFSDTIGKTIWLPSLSTLTITGFYMICIFARHVMKSWLCRLGCALGVILLVIGAVPKGASKSGGLRTTWIDLGRDAGCLLQTEEKQNILINAGRVLPSDSTERILMPFLTSQGVRSLDAIILTRSQFDRVAGFESLFRSLKVQKALSLLEGRSFSVGALKITRLRSSKRFQDNAPLLVTYKNKCAILADVLSLDSQDDVLARNIKRVDVLQARFSPGVKWRPEFVQKIRPKQIVDTGPGSTFRPCAPPWDIKCVVPQKLGWFDLSLSENPDSDKACGETAGVRPPSNTAHISPRRLN